MKKLILPLLFMISCSSNELTELNLTYVKTPLNVPAIISVKKSMVSNAFTEQNIKVSYYPATTGSQQVAALVSGEVDIVPTMGGTSAIIGLANGAPLKIIGIFSRSPKSFMLVSKDPSIQSIIDLKNKKIGGPKGTVLHQLLLASLLSENLSINDVDFISMGVQDALTSLLSGDIDVAMLVGPATTKAQQQGASIVTTGENFVDGTTVIATTSKFIEKYPDIVKEYLSIHKQSVAFMTSNPEETLELVNQEVGLPQEQIKQLIPNYDFSPTITSVDIDNLNKTQDFLFDEKIISNKIDLSKFMDVIQ